MRGKQKRKTSKRPGRSSVRTSKVKNKVERVLSGIGGFDSIIEHGFVKNTTNLIVGNSGSGKSIFAMQFLIEGMKNGENCLFVTFEEKKDQFYANMFEFGWNLDDFEKKGLFTFLEYTPSKVKTMLEEGGGTIESLIISRKITRIVIDSMTSFELLFEDELSKREAAIALFGMIRDWNCTSLLTYEEEPTSKEGVNSRALEFESDSIVVLYYVSYRGKRTRFLEVLKMRGTHHSHFMYPFDITSQGIVMHARPVTLSFGR